MNATEIKTTARALTINALTEVLNANAAVQFADASFAILQEVDGQEVWTEVTVKSKAYNDTARTPAFDPFVTAEAWQAEKAAKAAEKAAKAKEKAEKAARDKAKREAKAAEEAE